MKKFKLYLAAALCCLLLASCGANSGNTGNNGNSGAANNTTQGADKNDSENMGDAVGDAVDKAGNAVGDTVKDVGDAVGDATKDMTNGAKNTIDNMAGTKAK